MPKGTNPLLTEKDGREFAYWALDQACAARQDKACAYPYPYPIENEPDCKPFRKGPQWAGLQLAMFRLFKEGTEAAQLGFCSILTDHLAEAESGITSYYRKIEKAGLFQPFGTKGSDYPKVHETITEEQFAMEQARAVLLMAKHRAISIEAHRK